MLLLRLRLGYKLNNNWASTKYKQARMCNKLRLSKIKYVGVLGRHSVGVYGRCNVGVYGRCCVGVYGR